MRDKKCQCKFCKSTNLSIKEYKKKTMKGLKIGERDCLIEITYNRLKCNDCSRTFSPLSFSSKSTISPSVINKVMKMCSKIISYKDIAEELHISVTSVINIFDQNVPNLRVLPSNAICVDEFKNVKDPDNKYACVFIDFETGKIIHILKNRTLPYLRTYMSKQPKRLLNSIKYFICDMYDGYITIAKDFMPNAKIAIDPFHYMRYFTDAIHKIRLRTCNKDLLERPQNSNWINTNWKLLTHNYTQKEIRYVRNDDGVVFDYFEIVRQKIKEINDLSHGFTMLQDFYWEEKYAPRNTDEAVSLVDFTISRMFNSGIDELIECGNTWNHYKEYIVNSFVKINGRRLSNGPMEGTNSRIKSLKKVHCGYSNQERFYERIIYVINSKR